MFDGVRTPHLMDHMFTVSIGRQAHCDRHHSICMMIHTLCLKCQSAGTTAQTNIGNCADVVAGAGSTVTGQSGFELSGTMAAGIATCKIIALHDTPDNAFGANAVMEVPLMSIFLVQMSLVYKEGMNNGNE